MRKTGYLMIGRWPGICLKKNYISQTKDINIPYQKVIWLNPETTFDKQLLTEYLSQFIDKSSIETYLDLSRKLVRS